MSDYLSPSRQLRVLAEALEAYGTAPYPHPTPCPLTHAYSLNFSEEQQNLYLVKPVATMHLAGLARLHDLDWGPSLWTSLVHPSGASLSFDTHYENNSSPAVITPEILNVLADAEAPSKAYYLTPEELGGQRERLLEPVFAVRIGVGAEVSRDVEARLRQRLSPLIRSFGLPVRVRRFAV